MTKNLILINAPTQFTKISQIGAILENKTGQEYFKPNLMYQYLRKSRIKDHINIYDFVLLNQLRILDTFMNKLWDVAVKYGYVFLVTSGYRSPLINAAVGGSKTSQHMHCEAVDFTVYRDGEKLTGRSLIPVFDAIDAEMGEEVRQMFRYNTFIHASMISQDINRFVPHRRGKL